MVDKTVLARAIERLIRVLGAEPARWLLVDVSYQVLLLIENRVVTRCYTVSTAAAGINAQEGSGGTPPGVHRINEKIGAGMPWGTVFVGREPTGEIWSPTDENGATDKRDLILTRILTLAGLESGVNQGPGVDSLTRNIYLHGTNHEDLIGQPVSHGCIRLTNNDIIDLFDRIEPGDSVVIE